ncbi:MAG: YraN family protein [Bdellovibrionales bacterium]
METYKKCQNQKHKNGLKAEIDAANFIQKNSHFHKIFHRVRTPYGELDLVLIDENQNISIIEVKSIPELGWTFDRLSSAQLRRLIRCHEWILVRTSRSAKLEIVFVKNSTVHRFPVQLGDF